MSFFSCFLLERLDSPKDRNTTDKSCCPLDGKNQGQYFYINMFLDLTFHQINSSKLQINACGEWNVMEKH